MRELESRGISPKKLSRQLGIGEPKFFYRLVQEMQTPVRTIDSGKKQLIPPREARRVVNYLRKQGAIPAADK